MCKVLIGASPDIHTYAARFDAKQDSAVKLAAEVRA
jgi:hypothetical protein